MAKTAYIHLYARSLSNFADELRKDGLVRIKDLNHSVAAVFIGRLFSNTVFSVLLLAGGGFAYKGPIGVAAVQRIDLLPQIKTGERCLQISSHDRTNGNADGAGSYLYDWIVAPGDTEQVLFDAVGPGCIYNIWTTIAPSSPRFFPKT